MREVMHVAHEHLSIPTMSVKPQESCNSQVCASSVTTAHIDRHTDQQSPAEQTRTQQANNLSCEVSQLTAVSSDT